MRRLYESEAYSATVNSWWEQTHSAPRWPSLRDDIRGKTLIIGAGYTGLNCALEIAADGAGEEIILIDAQQPGWGASGRNGGFCCMGGSKLSFENHLRRFGKTETFNYFNAQIASVYSVSENLRQFNIEADLHSNGETMLAHTEAGVEKLVSEREHLASFLGIKADFVPQAELRQQGFNSPEFFGALTTPVGFALNPMKYVSGLAREAQQLGIRTFGNTPALSIERTGSGWNVKTPAGSIFADTLIIATNGYSSEDIPDWLAGRLLPALTNIIVSRPLTEAELQMQGWTSHQMCYDTRASLHYFHLLPKAAGETGPRMLFGMRAGTSSTAQSQNRMHSRIRADFERFFPAWKEVETPWFWSGLVCLTRDLTSFTGPIPGMPNAFASLGYHGNGVAMGSHCGKLLGKIIKGEIEADSLPAAMRQPPRKFPFPALRRSYLSAAYRWHEWRDG